MTLQLCFGKGTEAGQTHGYTGPNSHSAEKIGNESAGIYHAISGCKVHFGLKGSALQPNENCGSRELRVAQLGGASQ